MARKRQTQNSNNGKQNKNKRRKVSHEDSNQNQVGFQDLSVDLLGLIFRSVNLNDIYNLLLTSKSLRDVLSNNLLKNSDVLLGLLRENIKQYLGSTFDFAHYYDHNQQAELLKIDLLPLLKVLAVIAHRDVKFYKAALQLLKDFPKVYCLERDFLLTQLVRVNGAGNCHEICPWAEDAFKHATFFFDSHPDLLNTTTLADTYFLLNQQHKRLPIILDASFISKDLPPKVQEAFLELVEPGRQPATIAPLPPQPIPAFGIPLQQPQALPGTLIPPTHANDPARQAVLRQGMQQLQLRAQQTHAQGQHQLQAPAQQPAQPPIPQIQVRLQQKEAESELKKQADQVKLLFIHRNYDVANRTTTEEVVITLLDSFKEKMKSLIGYALNSIHPDLQTIFNTLNPEMQWQYVLSLCTPGSNILLTQLKNFGLASDLFKLSPYQIQIISLADSKWLFTTYKNETLTQIFELETAQAVKKTTSTTLNLSFIDRKIKEYAQQAHRKSQNPSLADLWSVKPTLCNPEYLKNAKFKELMEGAKTIEQKKSLTKQLDKLQKFPQKQQMLLRLFDYLKPDVALYLVSTCLKTNEVTRVLDYFQKYPIFQKISAAKRLVELLADTDEELASKIAAKLAEYDLKDLTAQVLDFLFRLYKEAAEINDYTIIDKVLNKLPSITVISSQLRTSTGLVEALIKNCNEPWFDMLTYEQMVSFAASRTLSWFVNSYNSHNQKIILTHFLLQYKGQSFTPKTKEIKAFVSLMNHAEKSKKVAAKPSESTSQAKNTTTTQTSDTVATSKKDDADKLIQLNMAEVLKKLQNLQSMVIEKNNIIKQKDEIISKLTAEVKMLYNALDSGKGTSRSEKISTTEDEVNRAQKTTVSESLKLFGLHGKPKHGDVDKYGHAKLDMVQVSSDSSDNSEPEEITLQRNAEQKHPFSGKRTIRSQSTHKDFIKPNEQESSLSEPSDESSDSELTFG